MFHFQTTGNEVTWKVKAIRRKTLPEDFWVRATSGSDLSIKYSHFTHIVASYCDWHDKTKICLITCTAHDKHKQADVDVNIFLSVINNIGNITKTVRWPLSLAMACTVILFSSLVSSQKLQFLRESHSGHETVTFRKWFDCYEQVHYVVLWNTAWCDLHVTLSEKLG